jgi:hypothetical protein
MMLPYLKQTTGKNIKEAILSQAQTLSDSPSSVLRTIWLQERLSEAGVSGYLNDETNRFFAIGRAEVGQNHQVPQNDKSPVLIFASRRGQGGMMIDRLSDKLDAGVELERLGDLALTTAENESAARKLISGFLLDGDPFKGGSPLLIDAVLLDAFIEALESDAA